MHRKRLLTSIILIPVLVAGLIWGGEFFFNLLLGTVTLLCLFEYFSMTFKDDLFFKFFGVFLGLIPIFLAIYKKEEVYLLFGLFLILLFSFIFTLFFYKSFEAPFLALLKFVFGASYIGISAGFIFLIRYMNYGVHWIFFLLMVVFAADTGAYYVGTFMGKTKLCPSISKGKTVEGTIGGIFSGIFASILSWIIFFNFFDLRLLIPLAILLTIISQIGDLAESVIKRACGVKDSGGILPGHGGVFDRIDSILLSGSTLFWILYFSNGEFFIN